MVEKKDYYGKIANQINDMIPNDWKIVYYLGEVENGKKSWSSVFYFVTGDGKVIKSHLIPQEFSVSEGIYESLLSELNDMLLEFYDVNLSEGREPWEQFSMRVENNGEFHAEYSYDAISGSDFSQAKREVIWAHTMFGQIPDSKYLKKVLDDYLLTKRNEQG